MVSVDGLTKVTQDYLKLIWLATERGGKPISMTELASKMGTSTPNVTDTLRRMKAQGLVNYQPYQPVELTEKGEKFALAMVRRHRLIESFLTEILHYDALEVHEEAYRLEHAVSDRFLERINEYLNHPTHDPHGHQIPYSETR